MQLAARAQAVGVDYQRALRPEDHASKLLTRSIVESVESLKAQEIVLTADLIGQAVAVHVGVMLGLIEPPKEVGRGG